MRNVMRKELTLSASPLAYLFIPLALLFLVPGYPVLCGAFFVTLGLFQSFQAAREANDIVFSALLPIAKKDVVKGKYLFACLIEGCALVLMALSVIVRMTALKSVPAYLNNALMNANPFALAAAFFLFGLFNLVFVGGFFRTVYKLGRPFVTYSVLAFVSVGVFEALHHVPGLESLNAFETDRAGLQTALLASGAAAFDLLPLAGYSKACRDFEKIDL